MEHIKILYKKENISEITEFLYSTNFENCREFIKFIEAQPDSEFSMSLITPIHNDVIYRLVKEGDVRKLKFMLEYNKMCSLIANICCQHGCLEILKHIITNYSDTFLYDESINNLISTAIENGNFKIAEYLLEKFKNEKLGKRCIDYVQIFMSACAGGNVNFVNMMLQKYNIDIKNGFSLALACLAGKIEVVEYLLQIPYLDIHANYDMVFNNSIRGLYLADNNGENPRESSIKIITMLLEKFDNFKIDKLPHIILSDPDDIEFSRQYESNPLNFDRETVPLHDINSHSDTQVLELLLKYSDKITFPLDNLQHVLEISRKNNNVEMTKLWCEIVKKQLKI